MENIKVSQIQNLSKHVMMISLQDFVAEEVVVVDASGGQAINTAPVSSAISAPNGRKDVNGTLDSFDASNIVEVNEEEIHLDDGSEEMSVAIDLAKLSQGHFSHNDFKNSGYVQFYSFTYCLKCPYETDL